MYADARALIWVFFALLIAGCAAILGASLAVCFFIAAAICAVLSCCI
jgi:hypothetical protein